MPTIQSNGCPIHVEVEGPENKPVLMLSNSLGTNLHMWDPQIPELTKHFRVIRYDSRGHGKSGAPDGPYSIEELGRDALAIMDALELDQVHWIGLSKGGMIGQWLLTHAPERIGRAVLANTGSHMPPPDLWNQRIRTDYSGSAIAVWLSGNDPSSRPDFALAPELLQVRWNQTLRVWADSVRKLRAPPKAPVAAAKPFP